MGDDQKRVRRKPKRKRQQADKQRNEKQVTKEEKANAEKEVPIEKSKAQLRLEKYVQYITSELGDEAIADYYVNEQAKQLPTIVATEQSYYDVAKLLKTTEQLNFNYLTNLHGTDFETHLEVYAHLFSYENREAVALKVKVNRAKANIASLTPLWAGANWPECETYDLLGINFIGHPQLHRILLGEDWIGYPLRKDYELVDVEG